MPEDETYILDICDKVLIHKSCRQHRFSFLLGDANKKGTRRKLPVDAFYPCLNLVLEYREKQHSEPVKIFDRRETISGCTRGEQRRKYDQRRRDVLAEPEHGLCLVEFDYSEFAHRANKRLIQNEQDDTEIVKRKLQNYINNGVQ